MANIENEQELIPITITLRTLYPKQDLDSVMYKALANTGLTGYSISKVDNNYRNYSLEITAEQNITNILVNMKRNLDKLVDSVDIRGYDILTHGEWVSKEEW